MSANPDLSPEASPGRLGVTGVRRVNNMPVYILGLIVGVFVVMIALVAYDRAHPKQAEAKADAKHDSQLLANQMAGDRTDGIIEPKRPSPPPEPAPAAQSAQAEIEVPIARPGPGAQADLNRPPVPPSQQRQEPSQRDNDLQRIHARKIQEVESALSAKTNVPMTDLRNRSAMNSPVEAKTVDNSADSPVKLEEIRRRIEAARTEDPTAAYRARMAQLQGQQGRGGAGSTQSDSDQTGQGQGSRNDIGQFAGSGQIDRWRLNAQVQNPRTLYELRAGFVIPGTMISGINSELPGQIMAQVSQNVYDTPTGKYLLIPQGSRLVGSYSSEVAYGQKRVLVAWQRIVFPDGKALDIGAMPGADGSGYAGFHDQVDNHYLRIFGSAFLMSAVIAAVSYSQQSINQNNNGSNNGVYGQQQTATGALSQALGQQLGMVTAQMIAKNLNIAPTLEIRPGFRFNVMVIKDLTFNRPYKSFDY